MSTEDTQPRERDEKRQRNVEHERAREMEKHKQETLNSLVQEQVIHTLGQPANLLSVQVRPLWGTKYRVNVFVGDNSACASLLHSFFLVTDDEGNILESTPKIEPAHQSA